MRMTEYQLAFWRDLLAPFNPKYIKAKGKFDFIDARALLNRLDSVCGPAGWAVEYAVTDSGMKCRISIFCPGPDEDSPGQWISKEDGAGAEGMVGDMDNDEKSKYTNAFRRCAQNAWGMFRVLYGAGIPTFLDPDDVAPEDRESLPGPRASQYEVDSRQPVANGGGQYAAKPSSEDKAAAEKRSYEEYVAAAAKTVLMRTRDLDLVLLDQAADKGYINDALRCDEEKLDVLKELWLERKPWVMTVVQAKVKAVAKASGTKTSNAA